MLDAARIDLSKYRLERAGEMLKTARRDLDAGDYASANNRAYYCVFHAMRATLALTGEDYKKHSGVISRLKERGVSAVAIQTGYYIDRIPDFIMGSDRNLNIAGETVSFRLKPHKVYLFDKETEDRIGQIVWTKRR